MVSEADIPVDFARGNSSSALWSGWISCALRRVPTIGDCGLEIGDSRRVHGITDEPNVPAGSRRAALGLRNGRRDAGGTEMTNKPNWLDGRNAPQRREGHGDGCKCNWKQELDIMLCALCASVVNNRAGQTFGSQECQTRPIGRRGRSAGTVRPTGWSAERREVGGSCGRWERGHGNVKQTQLAAF